MLSGLEVRQLVMRALESVFGVMMAIAIAVFVSVCLLVRGEADSIARELFLVLRYLISDVRLVLFTISVVLLRERFMMLGMAQGRVMMSAIRLLVAMMELVVGVYESITFLLLLEPSHLRCRPATLVLLSCECVLLSERFMTEGIASGMFILSLIAEL